MWLPRHGGPVPGEESAGGAVTHPRLGRLRLNCDVLAVPHDDQEVVFITADPGTPSARALSHLLPTG
ncbi:MmyB family transcriptional regulator [Nonomuraea cypriaca]|uniref:MmyB family transcriptional regulator n=1 Tax=Nonomuraea cypriaca TaxID=1187855 RepID=UPI001A9C861C|nr:hypothetical protein [Nonomuraea cypriaca]